MKKSFQFRIYPNRKQEVILNRTLSTCRHLYNDSLAERKKQAELNRLRKEFDVFPWGKPEWMSYEDQANDLSESKTDFQREVHSQVLQNTFTYPQSGFAIESERLNLSKVGCIKIIQHREIEGRIKTCTIKKDIDQWYAIFTVEIEKIIEPVEIKNVVGIDVGLSSLITMSNGEQIAPPQYLRKSENRLAKEQKRLSRKKKGSENRKKQKIEVAKVHRTIRNQRTDFAHKTSRKLADSYDRIVFEDLQIRNMMQNHHLAKSISDAGWNQLMILTKSKAEYAGKVVEFVNAQNTSQNCSGCGNSVPKDLSVRTHSCPHCGLVLDRDHNAAINILKRSISTAGTAGINACSSVLNRGTMTQDAQALQGLGSSHPDI